MMETGDLGWEGISPPSYALTQRYYTVQKDESASVIANTTTPLSCLYCSHSKHWIDGHTLVMVRSHCFLAFCDYAELFGSAQTVLADTCW